MKILKAGPILAGYENGFLRRLHYSGNEIIRMIYFALRDHNWNTLNHQIENEEIVINDDDFTISYNCFHLDGGVAVMEWKGKISGDADGTITFEIQGKALEDFRRNRAGFCVLHPLNVTGSPCTILHDDASTSTHLFPVEVSPENPFRNIQAMTWHISGHSFSLEFEGDLFETEDQRNWGDASFKTFCTPLDRPFPVQLRRGDKVFQRIQLKPQEKLQPAPADTGRVVLKSTGKRSILPLFGIAASTEIEKLSGIVVPLIKALHLSHYRVDLRPASEHFASDFSREYGNAFALGLPLEVVLHLSEKFPEEMEAFAVICQQNKVRLKKVLLLQDGSLVTGQEIISRMAPLRAAFPKVLFGAGTNYNFNEINKNRFSAGNLDYISFSMDPQEHASDELTILENTGSLEHLVQSAKSVYGTAMQIHVSPLTMRKRFNPYATNPADLFLDEWTKADPRQKETLGALWTFGAICSLAKGMAAAVTFYQTAGNQGVMSADGVTYPLYETIRMFAPYQGKPVEIVESDNSLEVSAILLDGKILAVGNMTDQKKAVTCNGKEILLLPWEIRAEKL